MPEDKERKVNDYREEIPNVSKDDVDLLTKKGADYGDTWKAEGGFSAFFNLNRKFRRIYEQVRKEKPGAAPYDIFAHITADPRADGLLDDIRDLRCYALLIEAEMRTRGYSTQKKESS